MLTNRRVAKGQAVTAADQNQVFSGLTRAQGQPAPNTARDQAALPGSRESVICAAANIGESAIGIYQAAIIRGQLEEAANRNTLLSVSAMATGDDAALLAIALEDVPAGGVGRFCVLGICWAYSTGSGAYATPTAGSMILTRGSSGPAQVLAEANGLILVRFPVGGGAAAPAITPIAILCAGWVEGEE